MTKTDGFMNKILYLFINFAQHNRRARGQVDHKAVAHLRVVRPRVVDNGFVDVLVAAERLVVRGEDHLIVALFRHGHKQPRLRARRGG